jgi:carbon-monoxide dehydrogenase medium subunit
VKPAAFKYQRANTVEEATEQLSELGDDAKLLAGGQSLVPMMNFRLVRPSALVDIGGIPNLQYIEWCILATLLDAEVVAVGPEGERVIPASEFFFGFFMTALEPEEMIVEVRFPRAAPHAALQEFARRAGDYGIVAAAVALEVSDGRCNSARVVLGGVADTPLRVSEAERVLEGAEVSREAFEEAGWEATKVVDPPSDVQGTAEYRRDLSAVLIRRALTEATGNGG